MLQNRFLLSPHRQARHHLVLTASYHSGKGIWRDQKMMTDTEHGNLVYYETLSKYKIQDDQRMTAGLEYRFERLKDDKQDFFVDALPHSHHLPTITSCPPEKPNKHLPY